MLSTAIWFVNIGLLALVVMLTVRYAPDTFRLVVLARNLNFPLVDIVRYQRLPAYEEVYGRLGKRVEDLCAEAQMLAGQLMRVMPETAAMLERSQFILRRYLVSASNGYGETSLCAEKVKELTQAVDAATRHPQCPPHLMHKLFAWSGTVSLWARVCSAATTFYKERPPGPQE